MTPSVGSLDEGAAGAAAAAAGGRLLLLLDEERREVETRSARTVLPSGEGA